MALEARGVSKRFGDFVAVQDASFALRTPFKTLVL